MRAKINYILIILTIMLLSACCSKEYVIGRIQLNFSILDKTTNKDLFFGANKLFEKDSIYIKYITQESFNKINNLYAANLDSSIAINFNNEDTCFIKYPDSDIDTFLVQYNQEHTMNKASPCKQTYNVISALKYNGVLLNINDNPIKIYK